MSKMTIYEGLHWLVTLSSNIPPHERVKIEAAMEVIKLRAPDVVLPDGQSEADGEMIHQDAIYREFLSRAYKQDWAAEFIEAAKRRSATPSE